MIRIAASRTVLALAFGLAATACAGDRQTGPATSGAGTASAILGTSSTTPELVTCAPATARSATALIGPAGGILSAGNTRVIIPANALLAPTQLHLEIPESSNVEVQVTADDADHFVFESPIFVSIDYGRCGASLNGSTLSVWHIDPSSHALLENMGGIDLKLFHTITFATGHLSGYAICD